MWIHKNSWYNHYKAKHKKYACYLDCFLQAKRHPWYNMTLCCCCCFPKYSQQTTPSLHMVVGYAYLSSYPGPWFNIKMLSYQYRKSHCGDKTVARSSYLHNGISYTGKMSSLYWIRALDTSRSPTDFQWGSPKYPGQLDRYWYGLCAVCWEYLDKISCVV